MSYIDKDTRNPYQFVRKINEGGYTKTKKDFLIRLQTKSLLRIIRIKWKNTFVQKTRKIFYLRSII
jgi:hypothetical protein